MLSGYNMKPKIINNSKSNKELIYNYQKNKKYSPLQNQIIVDSVAYPEKVICCNGKGSK